MLAEETSTARRRWPADTVATLAKHLADQIRQATGAQDTFLARTTDCVLAAPGKMLRPRLLLLACEAAGGDPERAFPAAAGTECGHIASLIHDDIIDGDAERRGRAALHVKYDMPAAILTGDLLIFDMFLQYTLCGERGITAERVLACIRVLSSTCIEMCEGQALEAAISGRLDTGEAVYLRMIRLKTAGACRAAAQIGAMLAGAPERTIYHLREYGERLGLVFQIVDDILAYEGQAYRLGKPLESDVRNARVTLPIVYALRSRDPKLRDQVGALFRAAARDPLGAHGRLTALLRDCGALGRARECAMRLREEAEGHLRHLPPSEARDCLSLLADVALSRDH